MSVNVQIELARRSDLLRLHCESSLQRVGPSRTEAPSNACLVWCAIFTGSPPLLWLEGFAGRCVLPRVGEYQRVFPTELSRTVVQFAKQLYHPHRTRSRRSTFRHRQEPPAAHRSSPANRYRRCVRAGLPAAPCFACGANQSNTRSVLRFGADQKALRRVLVMAGFVAEFASPALAPCTTTVASRSLHPPPTLQYAAPRRPPAQTNSHDLSGAAGLYPSPPSKWLTCVMCRSCSASTATGTALFDALPSSTAPTFDRACPRLALRTRNE